MNEGTADVRAPEEGSAATSPQPPRAAAPESPRAAAPEPPGELAMAWRVFTIGALDPLRRKRGIVLAAISLLPVILILLAALFGAERGGGERFFTMLVTVIYHYIEVLVFIFLACYVLGSDMENRAMTFDLVCPVSRLSIFGGRYLTYVLSSLLIVLPALTVLYSVCMGWYGFDSLIRHLPKLAAVLIAAVIACLVYGSFFIFLSTQTRRAMLWSVLIVIIFSGVLANMPFRICMMTPLYHIRNLMVAISDESRFIPFSPYELERAGIEATPLGSLGVLLLLWVLWTGAGALFFNRKQFP